MNQQLERIATHLRAMQPEMKRLGDAIEPVLMVDVVAYIHQANLVQLKTIVNASAERMSDLVGCATALEDASCQLAAEIECENELCEGRR